nr:hypothetical protein [uncultured Desulfobacter sp.]
MNYLVLLLLSIPLILFNGCQTGGSQSSSAPIQSTAPSSQVVKTIKAGGTWITLFHCRGNDYLLETQITTSPGTIRLVLSGQGQAMEMPLTGGLISSPAPLPQPLSGAFDNEAGSFTAEDQTSRQGTKLTGVFESSNRFAAIIQGRNWQGASLMIGVRKGNKDDLENLMAQADSKLGEMASRTAVGAMITAFKRRTQSNACSKEESAWTRKIQEAMNQGQNRKQDPVKLSCAMFSNENFAPYFDDPLGDIGLKQGREIANKLRRTKGCGHLNTRTRFCGAVLNNITMILDNQLPLTRNYVMIENAGSRVIHNWMAATQSRVLAITKAYEAQPETGIKKIDTLASTAKVMGQYVWFPGNQNYQTQFKEARDVLIRKEFFISFNRFLAKEIHTFEELNQLACYPSNHSAAYNALTQQKKEQVASRIQSRMDSGNPNIVTAAKIFASQQAGVSDLSSLGDIRSGRFSKMAQYTSSQNLNSVQTIFDSRKNQILDAVVQENRAQMHQILSGSARDETKLRNLVTLRNQFAKSNRLVLDEPVIKAHTKELQQHAIALLTQLEPAMMASIRSADSPADMNTLLTGLIAGEDQKSQVVQRINSACQKRVGELTAFKPVKDASKLTIGSFTTKGLNFESELMAIYLGDFSHSRLNPTSVLVSGLVKNYLYAYGRQCNAYLPANKVQITESECAEEEIIYMGGVENSRSCIRWREVPTGLWADPYLYSAANQLERRAGLNMVGNMLSSRDPFSSRAIADDVIAIGNDMDNLIRQNKCGNAGLNRFEDNLYNFVQGKPALRLPGRETLAMVQSTHNVDLNVNALDLNTLLNDLISENARGWMMNQYINGSVSDIRVRSDKDGTPSSVSAGYAFSSLGKRYHAQVTLTFSSGVPACIYFSDAPQTCRHPSRGIINKYERGTYQK